MAIFAEIIRDKRPDLAKKAIDYVKKNAVMWKRNFRNTDDSTSYHALWIYNCYNVARTVFPKWLNNKSSKKSFEWLKKQWPPDGSSLGYNPNPDVLLPDIMYLGAYLHKDGTYKWLGDKMVEYAEKHNKELSGFRPGLVFKDHVITPKKPNIGSVYMKGPGELVQYPSENRPDKIVFREGWNSDDFYALLNLRFDGWHGYKGTNSFISIRYGAPFVVEDLVKRSWDWLPKGRAKRRDENMCRTRFNGFLLEGNYLRKIINTVMGFKDRWMQNVPKYTQVDYFITTEKIDASRTRLSEWNRWNNERICILVKGDYFVVCDFNFGDSPKVHSVSWHLRGKLNRKENGMLFSQENKKLSLYICAEKVDLIINDSHESFEPMSKDFAAEHDVFITADDTESEIASFFWPHRQIALLSVQKLEDPSPYFMVLKIETQAYRDILIVRNSRRTENFNYRGISVDSDIVLLRKTKNDTQQFKINSKQSDHS